MKYCTCVKPEPEEIERGQVYCMKCELEIERAQDAPDPDEDDFSNAPDVIDEGAMDRQISSHEALLGH